VVALVRVVQASPAVGVPAGAVVSVDAAVLVQALAAVDVVAVTAVHVPVRVVRVLPVDVVVTGRLVQVVVAVDALVGVLQALPARVLQVPRVPGRVTVQRRRVPVVPGDLPPGRAAVPAPGEGRAVPEVVPVPVEHDPDVVLDRPDPLPDVPLALDVEVLHGTSILGRYAPYSALRASPSTLVGPVRGSTVSSITEGR
jgi:hypothetical protein